MSQQSLEQYVASRYLNDLQQSGFKSVCQNDDKPLEDAMKMLEALNKATQFIKRTVAQGRATV